MQGNVQAMRSKLVELVAPRPEVPLQLLVERAKPINEAWEGGEAQRSLQSRQFLNLRKLEFPFHPGEKLISLVPSLRKPALPRPSVSKSSAAKTESTGDSRSSSTGSSVASTKSKPDKRQGSPAPPKKAAVKEQAELGKARESVPPSDTPAADKTGKEDTK